MFKGAFEGQNIVLWSELELGYVKELKKALCQWLITTERVCVCVCVFICLFEDLSNENPGPGFRAKVRIMSRTSVLTMTL